MSPEPRGALPLPTARWERSWGEVCGYSLKRTLRVVKLMVFPALPVSIAAMLLVNAGWFKEALTALNYLALPPEALGAISVCLANPVAAYAMLGDLLHQGVLDQRLVLLTLLLANFATSLRYILAHRLAYHVGLFGSRLGLAVTFVGALLRLGWTGVFIGLLLIL